jgi:hypothetical protein
MQATESRNRIVALHDQEQEMNKPWVVLIRAKGSKPHLPVKARLVRD